MGGKVSAPTGGLAAGGHGDARSRALSNNGEGAADADGAGSNLGLLRSHSHSAGGARDRSGDRGRARSLSSVADAGGPLTIPALLSRAAAVAGGEVGNGDYLSEDLFMEVPPAGLSSLSVGRVLTAHSLPAHFWTFNGFKCPICCKLVLPDDLECHLVICLTKPRISYNEDVLTEDKGECVICLEDLTQGDTIARLPCLCVYHKSCIDAWFQINRSCPEHPYD